MNDELTSVVNQSAAPLDEHQNIDRLVATVESREHELEAKLEARLAAAEQKIAQLEASATAGRKTLPAVAQNLLAKQGVAVESIEAGALDAALSSLSMEQRFAVKAQLLRAGLVS